ELRERPVTTENPQQAREIDRLRSQLSDQGREVERLKEAARTAQSQDRWAGDPILKDDLAAAERNLAQAREEISALNSRIESLQPRPEPEAVVRSAAGNDSLPVIQAVIGMLQLFDGLDGVQLGEATTRVNECKTQLTRVAKIVGIERIPT